MDIRPLRKRLLKWFGKHQRRQYIWRYTDNPFHILIAEILLQRTKADQVLPVYSEFIGTFPIVSDLAEADLSTIRRIILPLGLAWRGEKLKQAATDIMEIFNGEIPQNKEDLLRIRGVGSYVADSVLYQSFGRRISIVDSNIVRIIGRLYGMEITQESRRDKQFRMIADEMLPVRKYRDFNRALLDLGALVCTRKPRCYICPIKVHCNYYGELVK